MKRSIIILGVGLLSVFGLTAFIVKDDPFTELLKKLEEFTRKYPQEKVHLHLDKPYYAIGDDIWFKAYVIDSRTSEPTNISKVLYVELINEQDSLKTQLKLPMQSGITWGDFKLPDSLSEGNYRIRAYTQWMRNAGPQFFFDKTIKIGNSWANKVFTSTAYEFSMEKEVEKVIGIVQFTNKEGQPYVNNEVNYEVQLNSQRLSRGRAFTDKNGQLRIPILNTQPNIYKSGEIIAILTLPDKQKVTKTIPLRATSAKVDVQFFPESGHLIQGLPCKIGIKAINANGRGEDVSGAILDDEGTEIMDFQTTYLGMGNLYLNPMPNKTYRAKIKFKDGSEKLFGLPKIENSGYVLSINNIDTGKVGIKVLTSDDLINKGELKLLAQKDGIVYFTAKIPVSKQLITASIPKAGLPSGIITLTLFNTENIPVAERILFVNNEADKIAIEVQNLKKNYLKRGNVSLDLLATNGGKSVQGSFSVAITNSLAVSPDPENESNILTSLLLTSDLKGYVEKPNHYFLSDDAKTATDLDNLLLTQGWRKIDWIAVNNAQPLVISYQPEKELQISGTLTTNSGKPLPGGKVSLFSNSAGFFAADTLTDANGRFNFNDMQFSDSTKFVVQGRTAKNKKDVQLKLDIIRPQLITANKNTGDITVNVNQELKNYLQKSNDYFDELTRKGLLSRTIMLKGVEIIGKKNPAPNSSNLNGAGNADAVITAKDLEHAFSISQYLQSRIPGINIRNGRAFSMRANGGAMQIILDGIKMESDFTLDEIIVQDIESVEVLKSIGNTAIYGSAGSSGILVFTTKRGGSGSYNTYAPGIITYSPKGYPILRQFYSPKYDSKPDPKPDLRTTVYWNPHLVSNKEGKANINLFNTDQSGTYRVVIEGIDAMGNLARKTFTYQVN
ncbi:MAG: TonB-dependent receptor plug domain-containing protein [Bacteroidota bacterium]